MFGEDESESPRQPSPWQAISKSPSPSSTPLAVPSSFTRRASYLERMAIEACAQNSALAIARGGGGGGLGSTPLSRVNSARELAISLEAEALKMEGQLWAGETLAPEVDEIGHIEYKVRPVSSSHQTSQADERQSQLKLIAPTAARRAKLTTQLQWRLLEGGGTALYEIGVLDDGTLVGLSRTEMVESLITLESMAREIGAVATVNRVVELPEIIVRAGPVEGGSMPSLPGSRRPSSPASSSATCTVSPTTTRSKSIPRKKKSKNDPLVPPPGKGKVRIQPGDAAVSSSSSDSEGDDSTSAGERGSSTDASIPRSADTSIDTFPDLSTLNEALSTVDDESREPTPMEKAIMRRKRRDETRALRKARLSTSTNEGDSSADSSRPGSSLGRIPEPTVKPAPTPPPQVAAEPEKEEESGPRFVLEVLVQQEREDGQAFLDFEGFGLEV